MDKAKQPKSRILYSILGTLVIILSVYYHDKILSDTSNNLEKFSYIASVLTIVALIVSIGEIVHTSMISKSFIEVTTKEINDFKKTTKISLKHDCFQHYESLIENIDDEHYQTAYAIFCYTKKINTYLISNHADSSNSECKKHIKELFKLERKIFALRNANKGNGLNPEQKQNLIHSIFSIKDSLNNIIVETK
ncbi:MAG: hypothetical protein LBE52_08305 [Providencia sp.]|nr:hypothetical protein [Providencia sp.]